MIVQMDAKMDVKQAVRQHVVRIVQIIVVLHAQMLAVKDVQTIV